MGSQPSGHNTSRACDVALALVGQAMDVTEPSAQPGEGVSWVVRSKGRATVHFLRDSYAAQHADAELAVTTRLMATLEDLLGPPPERAGARVDLFLVDPVPPGDPDD